MMNKPEKQILSLWKIICFSVVYFFVSFVLAVYELLGGFVKIFIHDNFSFLVNIFSLLIFYWLFQLYKKSTWSFINKAKVKLKYILLIIVGTVLVELLINISIYLLLGDKQITKDHHGYNTVLFTFNHSDNFSLWIFLTVVGVCIMAPVLEELFFRGIIFNYLRLKVPMVWALIISAVFFGIGHGFESNILFATLIGLYNGLIYYKTRNIFYAMTAHMTVNIVSMFFLFPSLLHLK